MTVPIAIAIVLLLDIDFLWFIDSLTYLAPARGRPEEPSSLHETRRQESTEPPQVH